MPLPLPDPPDAIESHPAELPLLQLQPVCAVTAIGCEPPEASNVWFCRSMLNTQAAAACLMVTASLLTMICPCRAETTAFAATVYGTVPFPCPLVEAVSVIQSTLLFAAHEHSRLTTTDTIPLPPFASIVGDPAVAVTAQRSASAAGDGDVTLVDDDWHAADDRPSTDRRIANARIRAAYSHMTVAVYQMDRNKTRGHSRVTRKAFRAALPRSGVDAENTRARRELQGKRQSRPHDVRRPQTSVHFVLLRCPGRPTHR